MGEHADDILNGDVDQYTGEWIGGGMGYPRSLQQKTKNKKKAHSHTKEIIKNFPNLRIVPISGPGANVYTDNGVITFYWTSKHKYGIGDKWAVWSDLKHVKSIIQTRINTVPTATSDSVKTPINNNISDMVAIANQIEGKRTEPTDFQTPEQVLDWHVGETSDSFDTNYREDVVNAIEAYHMQFGGLIDIPEQYKFQNYNVAKCINHVLAKVKTIDKMNGGNVNQLSTLLKTVAEELKQYL